MDGKMEEQPQEKEESEEEENQHQKDLKPSSSTAEQTGLN